MPSSKIEYTILLSSPSDVDEERKAAMEVVKEVEVLWARPNDAVLKILSWENDVVPNFGQEPQQIINAALGEEWDIQTGAAKITDIMNNISRRINESAERVATNTAKLKNATKAGDFEAAQKTVAAISSEAVELAKDMGEMRRAYRGVAGQTFDTFSNLVSYALTAEHKDSEAAKIVIGTATGLVNAAEKFVEKALEAEHVLGGSRNLTKEYNTAQLALKEEFKALRIEVSSSISVLKDLVVLAQAPYGSE